MPNQTQPPDATKVILIQVVDRHGTPISGAYVDCFVDKKKFSTLKSGRRAVRFEVTGAKETRFVARYRDLPLHEGTPDANNICNIKFPEVDLSPVPAPPLPPVRPLPVAVLNVMLIVVGIFAIGAIAGGILLVYLGAAGGATEMNILGSNVKTSNAGIAAIALGGIVMLFTFRRLLKALENLGR